MHNTPTEKNKLTIKTFGNSMFPFFCDGDVLEVARVSPKRILTNDFITFYLGTQLVTHRVIYKNTSAKKPYFITKGDNNLKADKPVYFQQVVGKVVGVKRSGKKVHLEQLYFFQSSLYFQEISQVIALFEQSRVSFVILKGLPLHLHFEKAFPKRIYADCDILIDKNQFNEVSKLLERLGYVEEKESLSPIHQLLNTEKSEVTFTKYIHGFPIHFDIHFEAVFLLTQISHLEPLYPKRLLNSLTEELLHNKQVIRTQNNHFPILKNEYLVLYLALHLFHHNYSGAYRYELLATVLKKGKLDYSLLLSLIVRYKLYFFVWPVFYFLKKYYPVRYSSQFYTSLKTLIKNNELSRAAEKFDIFSEEDRIHSGVSRFKLLFNLSAEPSYRKILVFFIPAVVYSVLFVLYKKVRLFFFKNYFFLFQKFNKVN